MGLFINCNRFYRPDPGARNMTRFSLMVSYYFIITIVRLCSLGGWHIKSFHVLHMICILKRRSTTYIISCQNGNVLHYKRMEEFEMILPRVGNTGIVSFHYIDSFAAEYLNITFMKQVVHTTCRRWQGQVYETFRMNRRNRDLPNCTFLWRPEKSPSKANLEIVLNTMSDLSYESLLLLSLAEKVLRV